MEAIQLLVYDEKNKFSASLLEDFIQRGYSLRVLSMDELLSAVSKSPPDAVVMNFAEIPTVEQLSILQEIRSLDDHLPLFLLAPNSDVHTAVGLMKAGATDFMLLPVNMDEFDQALRRAAHFYHLAQRVYRIEKKGEGKGDFQGIVGQSPKMQENFKLISTVAKSNATVMIHGESGTGKELVAKAIHVLSGRPKQKFIDLNCGAIPRELLENELFGHERGAYTGADKRYIGSFERANGGTIFLDEISEMDPSLQVKILRVLQERAFMRVGGSERVQVDVRVVAATNRDLQKEVAEGRFREDLFYRLNVVPIPLPPLRDRPEDIPILARHFLNIYSQRNDKIFLDFHPEVMDALMAYQWPGNVRELENTIERIVVLANDSQVKLKHLPEHFQTATKIPIRLGNAPGHTVLSEREVLPLELTEKRAIESALKQCEGNILEAARKLRVGQATLYRKIRKFGIMREET